MWSPCSNAEQGCQAAVDDVKGDNFDVVEKCFKNLDSYQYLGTYNQPVISFNLYDGYVT